MMEKYLKKHIVEIMVFLIAIIILSTSLPANASSNGLNLSQLPLTWDSQSFTGFFYGLDEDLGNEALTIIERNVRIIPPDRLQYETRGLGRTLRAVKYAFNNNATNATNNGLLNFADNEMSAKAGDYNVVGWQAENYVGIKNKSYKLAKLVLEQGATAAEKKTLTVGETWEVGNGWTLTANSIDAKARQVWLTLTKDGVKKDDKVTSEKKVYTFVEKSIPGESDVPLFVTYIDSVFAGATTDMVQLRYTWVVSPTVTNVKSGDKFGVMEVVDNTGGKISLNNTDTSMTLSQDSTVDIMGSMKFRVADKANILRFYPMVEYQIGPTPPGPNVTVTIPKPTTPGPNQTVNVTVTVTVPPTTVATITPPPTKKEPGFEAIFAIAGLLAVAFLVLRQRK